MIKCCIFDLDGTLLYTLKTITHYVNLSLCEFGIEPITEEECRIFIGHGAKTLILRAIRSKGIDDEALRDRILEYYNKLYNANTTYLTEPYDGIPELLSKLSEKNIKLGVVSNKPDLTTSLAISSFFPGAFDLTRGGMPGIPLKPAPDGIVDVMSKLGVLPNEVIYIGDTGVDMTAGHAAGVRLVVGCAWGYRDREELLRTGADVVVDSPLELLTEVDSVD